MDREKIKRILPTAITIFIGLALAITYFLLISNGSSILSWLSSIAVILRPVLVGAVIAYVLKSTCNLYQNYIQKLLMRSKNANERKAEKASNIIAVVLTYITWGLVIAALLIVAIPNIVESVKSFITLVQEKYPEYSEIVMTWVNDVKADHPEFAPHIDSIMSGVGNWFKDILIGQIPQMGGTIILTAIDIVTFVKDIAIGFIISVLLLVSRKRIAKKFSLVTRTIFKEKHAEFIINETRYADKMFGGFLEGKIIDSTLIGVVYFVFLKIAGIEPAALIALICGFTNVIPFFGPFIGAIPSGLIILITHADDPGKLLAFIIFVFVIQFIDGNIIEPHIVGGNIKLSPFSVIFAVTLFGGLWGIPGLVLGVPIYAVIYDIIKKAVRARIKQKGDEAMLQEFKDSYEQHLTPKPPKNKKEKKKKGENAQENNAQPTVDTLESEQSGEDQE